MNSGKVREGSILAVVMDEASASIVFNVRGAAHDGGSKSITLDTAAMSPENRAYAVLHGMKQRVIDAAALSRNPETGKAATPADKYAAIESMVTHYNSGTADWNLRGAARTSTDGELAYLVRALQELKPTKTLDELREWAKSQTVANRRALMVSPAIKPLVDGYRAEAASDIDTDAMLAELG